MIKKPCIQSHNDTQGKIIKLTLSVLIVRIGRLSELSHVYASIVFKSMSSYASSLSYWNPPVLHVIFDFLQADIRKQSERDLEEHQDKM